MIRLASQLRPLPSTPLASATRTVVNNANRYTLATWIPTMYPSGAVVPAGSTEGHIRPIGAAALGLASAIACKVHDTNRTGSTTAAATEQAVRLIKGAATSHKANGGTWGDVWQSALWAFLAGSAGWLLWDELDTQARGDVERMVLHEAARMTGAPAYWCLPDGTEVTPGDSKSEEVAWDASILALALVMFPTDSRAATWMDRLCVWGMAAHATAADLDAPTILNGYDTTTTLAGFNVRPDGTIVNHGRIHPDYMMSAFASLWSSSALFGAAGALWPAAACHNVERVYQAAHRVQFPAPPYAAPGGSIYPAGGSGIYYPEGNDWGLGRIVDKACADTVAYARGWGGTNAGAAALAHMQAQVGLQGRSTTGQTYVTADEDTYAGREQQVAHQAALALLALCTDVTESNVPAAQLVAANATRGTLEGPEMTETPTLVGVATFPAAVAATHITYVPFPVGKFTNPPVVLGTIVTSSMSGSLGLTVYDVTATGCRLVLFHTAGSQFSSGGRTVHWSAAATG